MVVVGLLLLLIVIVVCVVVVAAGAGQVNLDLHWFTVSASGRTLFAAGAGTLLLAILGYVVLRFGVRRARRRRRERRELEQRAAAADRRSPAVPPPGRPTGAHSRRPPDADDYFDTAPRD